MRFILILTGISNFNILVQVPTPRYRLTLYNTTQQPAQPSVSWVVINHQRSVRNRPTYFTLHYLYHLIQLSYE